MYAGGFKAYVGPLVISLALAWINILYYSRGSKRMGMYNVMIQRVSWMDSDVGVETKKKKHPGGAEH